MNTDEQKFIFAVQAGCDSAGAPGLLKCEYPTCTCRIVPKQIKAAIEAYERNEK